ncbi:MAG: acetolactate synthase small subunit [Atopobiaceae bacterium]|jgi:acetolactate synthase-1/3 small subunit
MSRYTLAILVRNEFGVLNRVTSMFRRRMFNISCLTVSETETQKFSRITVIFDGEDQAKRQLVSQLHKLPDIVSVKEFDRELSVSSELLLIKMDYDAKDRRGVLDLVDAFDAKILDYTRDAVVIQVTGDSPKIDAFIDLMRDYRILEICRTGVVSLERGPSVMRNVTKL